MKIRSALFPLIVIPALALAMTSCEKVINVGVDVTEETASIDDDKEIAATADELAIEKKLKEEGKKRENAEKNIANATRDLADVNSRIAELQSKQAELKTKGVALGTYASPGGGAAPVAPIPSSTAVPEVTESNGPTRIPTPTPTPTPAPTLPVPTETATIPSASASAPAEGMMDLVTEFPIPMFIGTPVPVKLSNLEPPGKPKLTMPVPVGTTNVAVGKTVTSSDPEPTIGDLGFVTDGDKDGGDGYFVELGFDTQWVQVDLEKEFNIHAILVWHFHKAACAYYDVIVQVSNDPTFTEATTIYNSDDDNSSKLGIGKDPTYIETNHGRIIDAKGAKARYVRLYSNGNTANDLNHYIEVEVHATE
ncbi:MAG: discoidin domain-containing protein [Verrucomicrobia bacterium]|nr:discoidin domain-containing protein [Verrucomicrobiota bacterium]